MNAQDQPKPRTQHRTTLMLAIFAVALVAVSFLAWYRPKVFSFYANVSPVSSNVSGQVFRSSGGVFLVRLNSGSQLTVEPNPPRVFLSPKSTPSGFRVGNYLVVPAASIGGVDLSKSESFGRQVPVIGDGKVTLKDPMQRDAVFYFPSGG